VHFRFKTCGGGGIIMQGEYTAKFAIQDNRVVASNQRINVSLRRAVLTGGLAFIAIESWCAFC
jgi:hypothetical protein